MYTEILKIKGRVVPCHYRQWFLAIISFSLALIIISTHSVIENPWTAGHANIPLYLFSLGVSNWFLKSRNLIIIHNGLTVECSFLDHVAVVNEWLLFNINSAMLQLYNGENKLLFNEMMMRSALCYTNTATNSPRIDMSPHWDALSWFRANQYLLFLLNVACLAEKQQIPIS
jgi:hypothetical protein